jgi:hypothetical protein
MPQNISVITNRIDRWTEYLVNDTKGMEVFNAVKADIRTWKSDPRYVAQQIDAFYRFHSNHIHADAQSINVSKKLAITKAKTIVQFFSFIEILAFVYNIKFIAV